MTTIGGVPIGGGHPCRVVAEISNNHNGSLDLAKRLIRECAAAGADFVKFQCYTPDELVELRGDGPAPDPWGADGWTMRDLYEKAQTPHAWFPELVGECKRVGIPWFSSVFGLDSLRLLERLGCPAYKVAALDIDTAFAKLVARRGSVTHKPIIASSRAGRIEWADLTLFCPAGYPQDPRELALYHLDRNLDGISYHGTTAFPGLTRVPLLECHVQLDDVPSELEANVSLTVSQLRQLCSTRGADALS